MPDADYGSWVAPSSVAEVIVFLASPDNKVTRGAVIPVYGGA
jgi:NAD(P)-dependent dehydrogenase (short-subunit alcohol dehydrogenase family)